MGEGQSKENPSGAYVSGFYVNARKPAKGGVCYTERYRDSDPAHPDIPAPLGHWYPPGVVPHGS